VDKQLSPKIVIIAALGEGRELGLGGTMPWRIPSDLKRFQRLTLGHTVIMGRVTYDSVIAVLGKPLPERESIVLTRRGSAAPLTAASLPVAIAMASRDAPVFVIGGASVYEAAMPLADELWLTHIAGRFPDADRFFPSWESCGWQAEASASVQEPGDSHATTFCIWRRQTALDTKNRSNHV
jgi:dihydrofolate reductase